MSFLTFILLFSALYFVYKIMSGKSYDPKLIEQVKKDIILKSGELVLLEHEKYKKEIEIAKEGILSDDLSVREDSINKLLSFTNKNISETKELIEKIKIK